MRILPGPTEAVVRGSEHGPACPPTAMPPLASRSVVLGCVLMLEDHGSEVGHEDTLNAGQSAAAPPGTVMPFAAKCWQEDRGSVLPKCDSQSFHLCRPDLRTASVTIAPTDNERMTNHEEKDEPTQRE